MSEQSTATANDPITIDRAPCVLRPLDVLARLPDDGAVCWMASSREAWAGIGIAAHIAASGPDRFEAAQTLRARLRARLRGQVEDARLMGGFAFDDSPSDDADWAPFGALQLWLPQVAWRWSPDAPTLQISATRAEHGEPTAALSDTTRTSDLSATVAVDEPWREGFGALVDDVAAQLAMEGANLQKVVLARIIEAAHGADPRQVAARLHARFPQCVTFAIRPATGARWLVGATPERLVGVRASLVEVDALAGSAPPDAPADSLLHDDKQRREHALVVEAIRAALRDRVDALHIPDAPQVDRLPNVAHLRTLVRARAREGAGALRLASALHPTPAVCGMPTDKARALIAAREPIARGWYSGGVGWIDVMGDDGALFVALRCALIGEVSARVFAGAGIVRGSRGADELQETAMKASAVLEALGASGP